MHSNFDENENETHPVSNHIIKKSTEENLTHTKKHSVMTTITIMIILLGSSNDDKINQEKKVWMFCFFVCCYCLDLNFFFLVLMIDHRLSAQNRIIFSSILFIRSVNHQHPYSTSKHFLVYLSLSSSSKSSKTSNNQSVKSLNERNIQ